MREELLKELRDGYDNEPSSLPKEADRMASLMAEAANELENQQSINKALADSIQWMSEDPYNVLSKINVNEHTEKKNGLTYLSWAWAWDTLMSIYPESYTEINKSSEGYPFWTDGRTCWVDVSVVIKWDVDPIIGTTKVPRMRKRSEIFPIMDYKNKSIPYDKVTSFDVNTALQRAWTKCIARHGLGFYIYAGQDLPNEEAEAKKARENEKINPDQMEKVLALYTDEEIQKMLKRLKLTSLSHITQAQAEVMINKRDRSLVNDQTETL